MTINFVKHDWMIATTAKRSSHKKQIFYNQRVEFGSKMINIPSLF
ncbi:hypothetical protein SynBIOSE41_02581 [Synechococcus sp. BIOS-E4-1]|nr:hypothetical protein SynBIOSE41_02581 [Synechococcus sp. BIOS-E4-1]